jgi:hypothetical protein
MSEAQSKIVMQRERMRLGQVRKSFAAGLDQHAKSSDVSMEFFATCVDYIKASMDRLHDQDQRIHDILKPHVTANDSEGKAILANLDMRLTKSRDALAKLVVARDAYRAKGAIGWADFKANVDMFMDVYFNVLLKGQHSTIEMQRKVFTDSTWDDVAGVTQDSQQIEATEFAMVQRYAPVGADPAGFKAGPPVV